jgi:DNA-binding NtrC family response regulator
MRETIMNKPKILIAEKDFSTRMQLVHSAAEAGYEVKTTISVAPMLSSLLRKQFPVVLLGDNFEENIQVSDLVRLMKTSYPQVVIILISDEISLLQVRKAREIGIFYHALKPVNPEDWQELTLAMECAFNSTAAMARALRDDAATSPRNIH